MPAITGIENSESIVLHNLTRRFGDLVAVDNLSLGIYKGEILGFLGPNGAGKSTCINMICGLLKPDIGYVAIDGQRAVENRKVFLKIGLCPQDIICWPKLTCLEQLIFTGRMYGMNNSIVKEEGLRLLDRMGLNEKSNKTAQTLSGGMKRRLNLALALIHNPEILILDEPEAGLDPQSRVMVREFIREISVNKTVILTSHNMAEVDRLANRIAIIDHGKLLLADTSANLKKSIGKGDILEIEIPESFPPGCEIERIFQPLEIKFSIINSTIIVRSKNAVEMIPKICSLLENNNISYSNLRLRENSLEDVFIHLTGRRIRE